MSDKLTRGEAREIMQQARMDLAEIMATTLETQRKLHDVIGITGRVYEAVVGEDAPEFTLKVVAS